ncbi:flagellar hook-basal body complex protein FliE [Entomohabitans teleogrylli]|uniref:flagellar hook-basal body complex protein FliE n=1 Tax=Entomohabitans teleogrylli TaxID=1384589 RepID=UPI0008FC480E|nr:flagellar hook-basal body complex protein FliE [Entomohabitans teleogrylli]
MTINPVNGLAESIPVSQAPVIPAPGNNNHKPVSFSTLLFNGVNKINTLQSAARAQSEGFISGSPDIALNDVMVAQQKSSIALNLGIQVRNKMVSAYQEIMNMAV